MKVFRLLCRCAWIAAGTLRGDPPPEVENPRDAAKREAWTSAVLIISVLEQGNNAPFPGIRAWLEDFRETAATTPPPESGRPFPAVDSETLVTRNPHFWTAFYEVQPGDPGLALLHAALLLSGGEAQRAAALATFGLQRPGVPEELKRGLTSLIAHCQWAQAQSAVLVREGIKQHDNGNFSSALRIFDAALEEWPANGWAHYERGSTLRLRAIDAARRNSPGKEAPPADAISDPPETIQCFARARQHDPLQLLAYQGEDPALRVALMALVRSGLPVWETMRKHPEQPVKKDFLRGFGAACRTAAIDDFALVLRQLVVGTRYSIDDRDFITECLRRLAPASLTPGLLDRLSAEKRMAVRQIVVPAVAEITGLTATKAEGASKSDAVDKPKSQGKSTAKKPARTGNKSGAKATAKKRGGA